MNCFAITTNSGESNTSFPVMSKDGVGHQIRRVKLDDDAVCAPHSRSLAFSCARICSLDACKYLFIVITRRALGRGSARATESLKKTKYAPSHTTGGDDDACVCVWLIISGQSRMCALKELERERERKRVSSLLFSAPSRRRKEKNKS